MKDYIETEVTTPDLSVDFDYKMTEKDILELRIAQLEQEIMLRNVILQKVESDLYHICLFNPQIESSSLCELRQFMIDNNIEIKD